MKVGANIGRHRKSKSVKIEYKVTQVSFDDMHYLETIHEEEKETPHHNGPFDYPDTPRGGQTTNRKLLYPDKSELNMFHQWNKEMREIN